MFAERYTVPEVSQHLGITEEQAWADIEEGRTVAKAMAKIFDPEGGSRLNWMSISREAIFSMRSGTNNEITWEQLFKRSTTWFVFLEIKLNSYY